MTDILFDALLNSNTPRRKAILMLLLNAKNDSHDNTKLWRPKQTNKPKVLNTVEYCVHLCVHYTVLQSYSLFGRQLCNDRLAYRSSLYTRIGF